MAMNIGQSSSTSGDLEVMLEMNTTPLIDVMLVLLVMLIITIPLNMHSVTLDVTKQEGSGSKPQENIIVEIKEKNQILWGNQVVSDQTALENFMLVEAKKNEQPEIHFKPAATAKYEDVARVMATAQRLGLLKIGIANTDDFASPPTKAP